MGKRKKKEYTRGGNVKKRNVIERPVGIQLQLVSQKGDLVRSPLSDVIKSKGGRGYRKRYQWGGMKFCSA